MAKRTCDTLLARLAKDLATYERDSPSWLWVFAPMHQALAAVEEARDALAQLTLPQDAPELLARIDEVHVAMEFLDLAADYGPIQFVIPPVETVLERAQPLRD